MRKMQMCLCALLASALVPSIGFADLVEGSSGQWVALTAATPTNSSGYFWDNKSWDGTDCNIGFILTGTANGCGSLNGTLPTEPVATPLSFWAATPTDSVPVGDTAVSSMYFQVQGVTDTIELQVTLAGNASSNQLWMYQTDKDGNTLGAAQEVFAGGAGAGTSTTLNLTDGEYYGFYIVAAGGTYNSISKYNTGDDTGGQNFALFSQNASGTSTPGLGTTYWIGVEDLTVTEGLSAGDMDYQDMVFSVSQVVPEPASILLFGVCMLGLGRSLRRYRA